MAKDKITLGSLIKKSFIEYNDEVACYKRFVKLQQEKMKGHEVEETESDVKFRNYLIRLLSAEEEPKNNPIGFC